MSSTEAVHAGEAPKCDGSAVFPIFQSATFSNPVDSDAPYSSVRYTRCNNNPTQITVARKIAQLEAGEGGLVTSSGLSAISSAILAICSAGDHILVQSCLYGGTYTMVHDLLPRMGISFTEFASDESPSKLEDGKTTWDALVKPNTKMIFVETISNPLCAVADIPAVLDLARRHGLVSMIDNTFASPVNLKPLKIGFDIVAESGTKYLNGHSDVIAGVVAGRQDLMDKVLHQLNHLGGTLDPHACFLLQRGIKTVALRVARANQNALALATALQQHPAVAAVHYPGLPQHRSHELATQLFTTRNPKAGFGGVFAFDLKGGEKAAETYQRVLKIGMIAPSLGGVETLVTRPAATSHKAQSPEQRKSLGIEDGLIRVAVGIEETEDLLADFLGAADACMSA